MPILRVEICEFTNHPAPAIVAGATLVVDDLTTPAGAQVIAPLGDVDAYCARVEAFDAPVYVAVGDLPDPTREPRMLVLPRRLIDGRTAIPMRSGERLAAVLAQDVPWPV